MSFIHQHFLFLLKPFVLNSSPYVYPFVLTLPLNVEEVVTFLIANKKTREPLLGFSFKPYRL